MLEFCDQPCWGKGYGYGLGYSAGKHSSFGKAII